MRPSRLLAALALAVLPACASSSGDDADETADELGASDTIIAKFHKRDESVLAMNVDDQKVYVATTTKESGSNKSVVRSWDKDGQGLRNVWEGAPVVMELAIDATTVYVAAYDGANRDIPIILAVPKMGGTPKELYRGEKNLPVPGQAALSVTKDYLVGKTFHDATVILDKSTGKIVRLVHHDEYLCHDEHNVYLRGERGGKTGLYSEPVGGGSATLITSDVEPSRSEFADATPGMVIHEATQSDGSLFVLASDEPRDDKYLAKIDKEYGTITKLPFVVAQEARQSLISAAGSSLCLTDQTKLRCQDQSGGQPKAVAASAAAVIADKDGYVYWYTDAIWAGSQDVPYIIGRTKLP